MASIRRRALGLQASCLLGFVAAWEGAARVGGVDPQVLPAFSDVLATLLALARDPVFLGHAGVTGLRIGLAFVIGVPLAILAGFHVGERARLHRRLGPWLNFLLAVPQSMLLPMFILVFGVANVQKVVFGITHLFFVLMLTTIAAVRSVPAGWVLAARSFGATRAQTYWRVYVPAMLPLLVAGLRMALIFDVIGVLLAEMYAAQSGLGLLMMRWGEEYQVRKLMAAVLLVSLLTVLFNEIMRACESALDASRRAGDAP